MSQTDSQGDDVRTVVDAARRWAGFVEHCANGGAYGKGKRAEVARKQAAAIGTACDRVSKPRIG